MSRFNTRNARATGRGPLTSAELTRTANGAPGYTRDAKSELFTLGVANLVGQTSFYESAGSRDDRFTVLVRELAVSDPEWAAGFLRWLRQDVGLRTAAVVGAAEFASARRAAGATGYTRQVVADVLQRPDEPGELLGYWLQTHGRSIPMPVKRGVIDAIRRLWSTDRAVLKYDTASHGLRFGDVIELVHPRARTPFENALYRHAIDRRHGRGGDVPPELSTLRANATLRTSAQVNPRALLNPDHLRDAGMTWENAMSLAGNANAEFKRDLWSALAPSMGYMALLRNLRNFDDAEVSDEVAGRVADRLSDPDQVARSRQFPLRFLNAYRAARSLRWAWPLEQALNASLSNVPALPGRTLVLVDRSASMFSTYSARSDADWADTAAVFGVALATRAADADLVQFGSTSHVVPFRRGDSVLSTIREFGNLGGTNTADALRQNFRGHTRVVVLTDEQAGAGWRAWGSSGGNVDDAIPADVPMYTWNLAGYRAGHAPTTRNRHTFAGLTDAAFRMIPLIERGRNADWPWLAAGASPAQRA